MRCCSTRRARRRRLGLPRAGLRDAARPRRGRLHRPLDRRPAGARPAARGRRLDHQALPPRGGDGPDRSGLAPPPPRPRRGRGRPRSSPASWRSAPTSSRPSSASGSLDLTRREFELLQLLADAKGQVLEREAIYQRVWGYAMAHGDRSVDVFIRKLRQKLEKRSPGWGYIHTHFGVGYRFDPEPVGGIAAREARRPSRPGSQAWRPSTSQPQLSPLRVCCPRPAGGPRVDAVAPSGWPGGRCLWCENPVNRVHAAKSRHITQVPLGVSPWRHRQVPTAPEPAVSTFTSRSQQLHGGVTAAARRAMLGRHGRDPQIVQRSRRRALRSGPRSTRRWSTAGR